MTKGKARTKTVKMGGETPSNDGSRASIISPPKYNLFGKGFSEGVLDSVNLVADTPEIQTNQGDGTALSKLNNYTVLAHPINFNKTILLKDISTHHSACIQSKVYSTVGLGFYGADEIVASGKSLGDEISEAEKTADKTDIINILTGNVKVNSKVDDELDSLTFFGFQNELLAMTEDFMDTGTGYLEVIRDADDEIVGITHIPVSHLWPCIHDNRNLFYLYKSPGATDKYFALFGKKNWLVENPVNGDTIAREDISEVIPFIMPSNRVKFFGYPDWLSAVVDIDLTAASKQYKADFYTNRGVLDFIISVLGTNVSDSGWNEIKSIATKSVTGKWRNGAINLSSENAKVQVDKLAMDMKTEEQFKIDNEVLSQNIVSAHRTPPLLANILIPGKLGASNEFVNALIGYQLLAIGPYQNIIQSQLGRTLGNEKLNAGLGLSPDDFRFRTITSQINITGLDTVSRSRSEANDGDKNDGRDYEEGVLD